MWLIGIGLLVIATAFAVPEVRKAVRRGEVERYCIRVAKYEHTLGLIGHDGSWWWNESYAPTCECCAEYWVQAYGPNGKWL